MREGPPSGRRVWRGNGNGAGGGRPKVTDEEKKSKAAELRQRREALRYKNKCSLVAERNPPSLEYGFGAQTIATERLLVPEGDHGVDLHGAARGDVAGKQSDEEKHRGDGDESERVAGACAIEQTGH